MAFGLQPAYSTFLRLVDSPAFVHLLVQLQPCDAPRSAWAEVNELLSDESAAEDIAALRWPVRRALAIH